MAQPWCTHQHLKATEFVFEYQLIKLDCVVCRKLNSLAKPDAKLLPRINILLEVWKLINIP